MGGDYGPSETVPAAAQALSLLPHLNLLLFGNIEMCAEALDAYGLSHHPNVSFVHTTQSVSMAESPAFALRHQAPGFDDGGAGSHGLLLRQGRC